MPIYLHNCTQGRLEVCYRGDFTPPGRDATQRERQGFKRVVMEPWSAPSGRGGIDVAAGVDASGLIGQLQRAGGMATTDRLPRNTTVAFLFDPVKPISLAMRDQVVRHNRGVKTEEGAIRRRNAAIGTDHMLGENLVQHGLPAEMKPPEVRVEFEQTQESEQDDRGRLEEGYLVKPDKRAPPKSPQGRRKAA